MLKISAETVEEFTRIKDTIDKSLTPEFVKQFQWADSDICKRVTLTTCYGIGGAINLPPNVKIQSVLIEKGGIGTDDKQRYNISLVIESTKTNNEIRLMLTKQPSPEILIS